MDKNKERWLKIRKEASRKHADGKSLTLEETAIMLWNPETEDHPMSGMNVLKIERKALAKVKTGLAQLGLHSLDDIFDAKFREHGNPV